MGKPTMIINPNKTVIINGLPDPCIEQIAAYNNHPDIETFNAIHGSTTIINGTAVFLSGMPSAFDSYLESIAKTIN
jgi:hypothetical protein